MHYTAYKAGGLPLPLERTAFFLVPLAVALFSIASSVNFSARMASIWQSGSRLVLTITAIYLLSATRLFWFQQWSWDAETRQLYDQTAWWAKQEHATLVASSWHFLPSLNFYKVMSGRESLTIVNKDDVREGGAPVFVLLAPFDQDLIEKQKLRVVWRGWTGAIIATRPQPHDAEH